MAAGTVYLRTNRFEVKLEGITFKTKDFEALCRMDFLFPDGKVWARPPIVGLDVMRHPRDPSILLVLLCFGVGCVILRFFAGEALPASVQKFLTDKRIHFVGFGIPEKKELFPFQELGLTKSKVDIGYLAAKILKYPKCKRWELAELARKVIGIKRMIGLTEASSLGRHEEIKCAICQLFITSVIAMGLSGARDKILHISPKKSSFLKNLNSIQLLAEGWFKKNMDDSSFLKNLNSVHSLTEGWFKLPTGKNKKKNQQQTQVGNEQEYVNAQVGVIEEVFGKSKESPFGNCFNVGKFQESPLGSCFIGSKVREGSPIEDPYYAEMEDDSSSNDLVREVHNRVNLGRGKDEEGVGCNNTNKKPIKGILKCPSSNLERTSSFSESPPTPKDQMCCRGTLKRANSKGCNVSFTLS